MLLELREQGGLARHQVRAPRGLPAAVRDQRMGSGSVGRRRTVELIDELPEPPDRHFKGIQVERADGCGVLRQLAGKSFHGERGACVRSGDAPPHRERASGDGQGKTTAGPLAGQPPCARRAFRPCAVEHGVVDLAPIAQLVLIAVDVVCLARAIADARRTRYRCDMVGAARNAAPATVVGIVLKVHLATVGAQVAVAIRPSGRTLAGAGASLALGRKDVRGAARCCTGTAIRQVRGEVRDRVLAAVGALVTVAIRVARVAQPGALASSARGRGDVGGAAGVAASSAMAGVVGLIHLTAVGALVAVAIRVTRVAITDTCTFAADRRVDVVVAADGATSAAVVCILGQLHLATVGA